MRRAVKSKERLLPQEVITASDPDGPCLRTLLSLTPKGELELYAATTEFTSMFDSGKLVFCAHLRPI